MAYTIKSGDTLSGIAQANNTTVNALLQANPTITNPNLIQAGANLNLPSSPPSNFSTPVVSTGTMENGVIHAPFGGNPPANEVTNPNPTISPITASINDLETQIAQMQQQALQPGGPTSSSATQTAGTAYANAATNVQDAMANRQSMADMASGALTTALARYGLTEGSFAQLQTYRTQLGEYQNQLNTLDTQENEAIFGNEQRQTSMIFIEGRNALIQRAYGIKKADVAGKASVVASQSSALRGDIDSAVKIADQAVQYMVYDQEQKISDMKWAMDTYKDMFDTLDKKDKDIWDRQYQMNIDALKTKKEDLTAKMNYITDASSNGVDLGLTTEQIQTLSQEEVARIYAQKVGAYTAKQNAMDMALKQKELNKESGSENLTFLDSILSGSIIDDNSSPDEAVLIAQGVAQKYGINLKTTDLEILKKRAIEISKNKPTKETITTTPKTIEEVGTSTGRTIRTIPSTLNTVVQGFGNTTGSFFSNLWGGLTGK